MATPRTIHRSVSVEGPTQGLVQVKSTTVVASIRGDGRVRKSRSAPVSVEADSMSRASVAVAGGRTPGAMSSMIYPLIQREKDNTGR